MHCTLMAEVELLAYGALLALHNAAPVEPAEAVLLQLHGFKVVAPLTAQQVAAAHVQRRAVAGSAPSPQRTRLPVWEAEVRGLGRIDEVLLVRRFDVLANRDESLPIIPSHHLEEGHSTHYHFRSTEL